MKKFFFSFIFFVLFFVGNAFSQGTNYLLQAPSDQLLHFSYDTDLNSGAATYSYKFKLPPARVLTPDLQLTYSSYRGWQLSAPSISRSETNKDIFVLNFKNTSYELVDVGAGVFRPSIDEHDLKIQKNQAGWVVFTTTGDRYYFETLISNASYAVEWKLSKIEDVLGNYIEYHYDSLGDQGSLYLTSIFYNGQRAVSLEPNLKIEFSYEKKGFVTQSYKEGVLLEASYRCRQVQIFYKEGNDWIPFSQYQFQYVVSSQTHTSLLSAIQYEARGAQAPQVTFQYKGELNPVWTGINTNMGSSPHLMDVDMDGALDHVQFEADKGLVTYLNKNRESEAWTIKGESFESGILADFDADGFLDFAVSEKKICVKSSIVDSKSYRSVYFRGTREGFVRDDEKSFPVNLTYLIHESDIEPYRLNAGVRAVDLNGDRILDLFVSRRGFLEEASLSTAYIFEKGKWVEHHEWSISEQYLWQLDFNGDGLADFVSRSADGSLFSLFVNNGKGWNQENFPWPEYLKKDHFLFADLNQDGISDLIVEQNGVLQFFLLLSGKYEEIEIVKTGSFEELALTDYNLDGFVDVVVGGHVYLSPYKKEFLTHINNGLGAVTNSSYALSNAFFDNRFPFVLEVVSQVQTSSGFGEMGTVSYEYEWGRTNLKNREFLGFHRVTEKRAQTQSAEAQTIQRYFSHDPVLHGKLISEEVPHIYQDIYEWSYRFSEDEEDIVKKPQLKSKIRYVYEGATPPLKVEIHFTYEWTYDKKTKAFLKAVQESFLGQHIEHKFRKDFLQDEKITTYMFATNTDEWLQKLAFKDVSDLAADPANRISRTQRYWYDGLPLGTIRKGLVTMEETARSIFKRYTYNEAGLKISERNPLGHETRYEYDPTFTFVQKETNPLGFSMLKTWDKGCGNVVSETDAANDTTTTFNYDGLCRILSVSEPRLILDYSFSSPYETHVVSFYGDDVTYFKDGLGRVLARFTKQGVGYLVSDHVVYDGSGNVVKKYYPYTKTEKIFEEINAQPYMSFQYDVMGRLKRKTTSTGSTTQYTYGQFSKTVGDATGHEKKYSYNSLGHMGAVQESQGEKKIATRYEYNVFGDLLGMRFPDGGERHYTYDEMGLKKTAHDDATGFNLTFSYDSSGHKIAELSQGDLVEYEYDSLGRLISKTVAKRKVATYKYDEPSEEYLPEAKNLKGRLSWVKDDSGVTAFSYDRYAHVIALYKRIRNLSEPQVFQFEYDAFGRLLKMVYPDKTEVLYQYQRGKLVAVPGFIEKIKYSESGHVDSVACANGVQRSFYYDQETRLAGDTIRLKEKNLVNSFTYNPLGFVAAYNQNQFAYDDLLRLSSWTNEAAVRAFDYDKLKVKAASSADKIPQNQFTFNSEYQLTEADVIGGGSFQYTYDYSGQRAMKRNKTNKFYTFYIHPSYDIRNGVTIKYIEALGQKVAMVKEGKTYFLHDDYLGSLQYETNQEGGLVSSLEYTPYGENSVTSTSPYTFIGKEKDETGLYYFESRYYDVGNGKFISPDKYPFLNPEQFVEDPQQLNLFSYARNNPVNYVDVDGRFNQKVDFYHDSSGQQQQAITWGYSKSQYLGYAIEGWIDSLNYISENPYIQGISSLACIAYGAYSGVQYFRYSIPNINLTFSIRAQKEIAYQSMNRAAFALRNEVTSGQKTIYRAGQFGVNYANGASQYWSPYNPLGNNYSAGGHGVYFNSLDFIIGGQVVNAEGVITRFSPPGLVGDGGLLEIVTEPGSVKLDFFHMP